MQTAKISLPRILIGNYPGPVFGYGYLTVDQPSDDINDNIARFRDNGSTQVQINRSSETYQLQVFGDAFASGVWSTSDRSLKTDIQPLRNTLSAIRQLKPSAYYFKQTMDELNYLPTERQFGILAQELATIFPNLVRETGHRSETNASGNPILHVNYTGLVPVLIAAVQELDSQLVAKDQTLSGLRQHLYDQQQQIRRLQEQVEKLYALLEQNPQKDDEPIYTDSEVVWCPKPLRVEYILA